MVCDGMGAIKKSANTIEGALYAIIVRHLGIKHQAEPYVIDLFTKWAKIRV